MLGSVGTVMSSRKQDIRFPVASQGLSMSFVSKGKSSHPKLDVRAVNFPSALEQPEMLASASPVSGSKNNSFDMFSLGLPRSLSL